MPDGLDSLTNALRSNISQNTSLKALRDDIENENLKSNTTNEKHINAAITPKNGQEYVSTLPHNVSDILGLIRYAEVKGDNYNAIYGDINGEKDLCGMTINEVLAYQKTLKNTACGAYQIIDKTLKGIVTDMQLTGNEYFNRDMQDSMAMHLLKQRGYNKYMNGTITAEQFQMNISKEWASIPKDSSNMSYYHSDGINKALVQHSDVDKILNNLKPNNTDLIV